MQTARTAGASGGGSSLAQLAAAARIWRTRSSAWASTFRGSSGSDMLSGWRHEPSKATGALAPVPFGVRHCTTAGNPGLRSRAPPHPHRIGPAVALFAPRFPSHVVAVVLPESWLILGQNLESGHPLGALPQVEMRHQQA